MSNDSLRIDKWLWFARFCKSRGLAQHWIEAGDVLLNGVIVEKCHQTVRVGDQIDLPRGPRHRHRVVVMALADHRGGAPDAARLYESLGIGLA